VAINLRRACTIPWPRQWTVSISANWCLVPSGWNRSKSLWTKRSVIHQKMQPIYNPPLHALTQLKRRTIYCWQYWIGCCWQTSYSSVGLLLARQLTELVDEQRIIKTFNRRLWMSLCSLQYVASNVARAPRDNFLNCIFRPTMLNTPFFSITSSWRVNMAWYRTFA